MTRLRAHTTQDVAVAVGDNPISLHSAMSIDPITGAAHPHIDARGTHDLVNASDLVDVIVRLSPTCSTHMYLHPNTDLSHLAREIVFHRHMDDVADGGRDDTEARDLGCMLYRSMARALAVQGEAVHEQVGFRRTAGWEGD